MTQKYFKHSRFSKVHLIVVAVVFGGLGVYAILQSKAAVVCDTSVSTSAALDSAVGNLANSGKTICVTANITGARTWTAQHTAMVRVVAQPNNMTIDMGSVSFSGAKNITLEGFELTNGGTDTGNSTQNIRIIKNYFHDMNSDALLVNGSTTNLEFSGNNVKCIAWTNVWTEGYGIRTLGGPNNGFKANYNTIDGCDNSADGMELGDLHNFEIIGNDIKNIKYDGGALPDPHADALMLWSDSSGGVIKDNRFTDSDDLLFNNSTDVVIENNLIVRMYNICHIGGPAGDSDNALRNFTWRQNTIYQCGQAWNSECGAGNAWGSNPPTTSCGYGLNSNSPLAGGAPPTGNVLDRNLLVGFGGPCSQFTSANHNLVRTPFTCSGTNQGGFIPTFANTTDYLPTNLPSGYSDVGYRAAPYGHTAYDSVIGNTCDLNASPANFTSQVTNAAAGQTICLDSGDYGTWNGTNKAIVIRAAEGESPQMQFNFGSGDSGFTLDGMTNMGGFIGAGASNITIKNSEFTLDSCYGIGCLDIEGSMTNIVIDGNDFTYSTGTTCSGPNSKIFTDTSGASPGSALTIKNNNFANGDLDAIHVGGGSGAMIENNSFINITDAAVTCPGGNDSNHTDNIQFQGGSQITIKGNYIKSCAGCPTQGITSFDSGTDGVIIENNVVDIRRPWAIELYSDKNSIVRHNTLVWYADADCDFTGVQCGMVDISRKTSDPVGSGTQIYDNITTRIDFSNSSTGTEHHNVSGQTATYIGPTSSHDGFVLASNSPVGKNAASDGTDVGVYTTGSGTPAPSETTPPTVSLTSPSAGATVSGTVTLSATASDNVGVAGVQFKVDGNNVGAEDTSSPYSISWNSTTIANGAHTITATARDSSGNAATSNGVSITISNTGNITIGETGTGVEGDSGNANLLLAQQATLGQTATIQSLSFYVTNAAGKLRLGIYDASGPSGGPGAKKAETAEITPVTGWNTANVTTSVSLGAGTYWLAYAPSDNSLAFKIDRSTGVHKYYSRTYGVMPTTFGTTLTTAAGNWSFYATLSLSAPTPKQGDLNNDGLVNIFDLSILLTDYGKSKAAASNPACDINNDNNINIFDMSILLSKYGT